MLLLMLLLLMPMPLQLSTPAGADSGVDAPDEFHLPPEVECRAPPLFGNDDDTGGCSLCKSVITPGADETD